MPQIVEVPGHGQVEFPDGMSDEQIASAIKANIMQSGNPEASTDILPEVGRVLDKGIRGGLSVIPALFDLGISGAKGIGKLALRAGTGEWQGEELPPVEDTLDAATPEAITPRMSMQEGVLNLTGGPLSKPQTEAGKYIGSGVEGLIGALAGPGGLVQPVRNAAIGATSGLGGEAGAHLLKGSWEPAGRLLGALLGGGTTAAATSLIPNANKLVRQAAEAIPEADWSKAKALAETLAEKEIPYLNSQLLGPSSTLDDVVSQAATNPAARPKFMQHLRDLPEKTRATFDELINTTFPLGIEGRKGTIQDIQELAANRIKGSEAAGRKAYQQALPPGVARETYDMFDIDGIRSALKSAADDPNILGKNSPGAQQIESFMAKYLPELQPGDVIEKGAINSLVKELNTVAPGEGYGNIATKIIAKTLKDATESDFGAARRAASQHWKTDTNPLKKSIIGDLAEMGGGVRPDKVTAKETAITWLFPKDQDKTREIAKVAKELGPDAVGQLLREHIMKSVSSTFKRAPDTERLQQPYKVLQSMLGTKEQTANVKAGIEIMARGQGLNPKAVSKGFFKTIDALDTIKDLKIPASINKAAIDYSSGENFRSYIIATASRMGRSVWEKVSAKTYEKIADMMTTPEGLKQIEAIARSPKPQAQQALLRSIIAAAEQDVQTEDIKQQ